MNCSSVIVMFSYSCCCTYVQMLYVQKVVNHTKIGNYMHSIFILSSINTSTETNAKNKVISRYAKTYMPRNCKTALLHNNIMTSIGLYGTGNWYSANCMKTSSPYNLTNCSKSYRNKFKLIQTHVG